MAGMGGKRTLDTLCNGYKNGEKHDHDAIVPRLTNVCMGGKLLSVRS